MEVRGSMCLSGCSPIDVLASDFGYEFSPDDDTYRKYITLRPDGSEKCPNDKEYIKCVFAVDVDCNNELRWDLLFPEFTTEKVVRRGSKKSDFRSKTIFAGAWTAYEMPRVLATAIKLWLDIRLAELKFAFR